VVDERRSVMDEESRAVDLHAMSASMNCSPWKEAIGWPNCRRSLA